MPVSKLFVRTTIIFVLIICFLGMYSYCTEDEIINAEVEKLQIDNFIKNIDDVCDENVDLKEVFQNSLKGESSKNILISAIEIIIGKQLKDIFKIMISILIIIIIYGMLKTVSENLGNDQTGKIGHFVQVIILITVLLRVYSEILQIVGQTVQSLSNFIYTLIPVFMSLNVATRQCDILYCNSIRYFGCYKFYHFFYKSSFNTCCYNCNRYWYYIKYFR